jgi:uncharacterized protein
MNHPYLRNLSPGVQLLAFMLISLCVIILCAFMAMPLVKMITGIDMTLDPEALGRYEEEGVLTANRILVFFNQLGLFLIPAFIFSKLVSYPVEDFLHTRKRTELKTVLIIVIAVISSLALTNFLYYLNKMLELPESMSGVEVQIRRMEEQSDLFFNATLSEPGVFSMILNLFLLAFIPALAEEFFFRGVLQRLFSKILNNPHIAIWVAAFVFSFMHLQFYGFLPRFMYGLLLGYIFFWTKNIWYNVLFHFLNNSIAVVLYILIREEKVDAAVDSYSGSLNEVIPLILSILILAGSMWLIGKNNSLEYWRNEPEKD